MHEFAPIPTELASSASLEAPRPLPSMAELRIQAPDTRARIPEPAVVLPEQVDVREVTPAAEPESIAHVSETTNPKNDISDIPASAPHDIGDIAIRQVAPSASDSSEIKGSTAETPDDASTIPRQPEAPSQEVVVKPTQTTLTEASLPEMTMTPEVTKTTDANERPKFLPPIKVAEKTDRSDRYAVVGPDRDLEPDLGRNFSQYIVEQRDAASYPTESPLTQAEKEGLGRIQDAISRTCTELGIDVTDRLPPEWHHHFFDRLDSYREAAKASGLDIANSYGTSLPLHGILMARYDFPIQAASTLMHETWHDVSQVRIKPTLTPTEAHPDNIKVDMANGYHHLRPQMPTPTAHGLTEYVTSMATDKAMYDGHFDGAYHTYAPMLLIGDAIVQKTADAHGVRPEDIENPLIRGVLNGDMTGMRLINEQFRRAGVSLGRERMATFLRLPATMQPDEAIRVAQKLDLPSAVENLEALKSGKPYRVFPWRWNSSNRPLAMIDRKTIRRKPS